MGAHATAAVLDVGERLLQEIGDVRVVQGVEDVAPAALANDEPEMAQHPQLVGDRGLLHLQRVGQLTDAAGAVDQAREDLDPAARRERLHDLGDLGGDRRRGGGGCGEMAATHSRKLA